MFITRQGNLRKIQWGDSFEASFRVRKDRLDVDLATCAIDALVRRYPTDVAVALTLDVELDEYDDHYYIHLTKPAAEMRIDVRRYWYSLVVRDENGEVGTAIKGIFEIVHK